MQRAADGSLVTAGEAHGAIRWPQIAALIALDVTLSLCWMAYNEFQPRLVALGGADLPVFGLLVIQVAILVLTPPAAGYLTDRLLRSGGRRVAVVNLGISLAAMLFMATALTLAGEGNAWPTAWLPVLVVLWLIAMNLFHSPALSMLELYAPLDRLPGVAALFTVVSGLAAALEPSLVASLDALGAPLTFAAGGVAVALAGYGFLRTAGHVETGGRPGALPGASPAASGLLVPFALGIGIGAGEALMSDGLGPWIERHGDLFGGIAPVWQSSLLYALAALAAGPLGAAGNRWGAWPVALAGAAGIIGLGAGSWWLPGSPARVAFQVFPVAYAALAVAALPVVFVRVPAGRRVFGVGLLFSGVELASGVADIVSAL